MSRCISHGIVRPVCSVQSGLDFADDTLSENTIGFPFLVSNISATAGKLGLEISLKKIKSKLIAEHYSLTGFYIEN